MKQGYSDRLTTFSVIQFADVKYNVQNNILHVKLSVKMIKERVDTFICLNEYEYKDTFENLLLQNDLDISKLYFLLNETSILTSYLEHYFSVSLNEDNSAIIHLKIPIGKIVYTCNINCAKQKDKNIINKSLEKENVDLKNKLATCEETLQKENTELKNKLENYEGASEKLYFELKDKLKNYESLEKENRELKDKLVKHEETLDGLSLELENKLKNYETLEKENRELKDKLVKHDKAPEIQHLELKTKNILDQTLQNENIDLKIKLKNRQEKLEKSIVEFKHMFLKASECLGRESAEFKKKLMKYW